MKLSGRAAFAYRTKAVSQASRAKTFANERINIPLETTISGLFQGSKIFKDPSKSNKEPGNQISTGPGLGGSSSIAMTADY